MLVPPGMSVTWGETCDAVGAIMTLSPTCGTPQARDEQGGSDGSGEPGSKPTARK